MTCDKSNNIILNNFIGINYRIKNKPIYKDLISLFSI